MGTRQGPHPCHSQEERLPQGRELRALPPHLPQLLQPPAEVRLHLLSPEGEREDCLLLGCEREKVRDHLARWALAPGAGRVGWVRREPTAEGPELTSRTPTPTPRALQKRPHPPAPVLPSSRPLALAPAQLSVPRGILEGPECPPAKRPAPGVTTKNQAVFLLSRSFQSGLGCVRGRGTSSQKTT